jgi:hypothetical protein
VSAIAFAIRKAKSETFIVEEEPKVHDCLFMGFRSEKVKAGKAVLSELLADDFLQFVGHERRSSASPHGNKRKSIPRCTKDSAGISTMRPGNTNKDVSDTIIGNRYP